MRLLWLFAVETFLLVQVNSQTPPSYAPTRVECPTDRNLLRISGSAADGKQTLSTEEQAFLRGRKSVTKALWRSFFLDGPGKATGYGNTTLLSSNQQDWPVLGIAYSGGGERATLYGAGVLQAMDSRTTHSPIAGVYQLASYITGVSGSSWLITSMYSYDHPTISDLIARVPLSIDLLMPGGPLFYSSWQFFHNILDVVLQKFMAGFPTTVADFWGVALGNHFLPAVSTGDFYKDLFGTARGTGLTLSGLANTTSFRTFQQPLPIVVSNHQPVADGESNPADLPVQGRTFIPLSAPVYEYSPLEFGSFDSSLSAFIPTKYLGTSLNFGRPATPIITQSQVASLISGLVPQGLNPIPVSGDQRPKNCVSGFDQLGFIMASSASICNEILAGGVPDFSSNYTSVIKYFIKQVSSTLAERVMAHYPNPFQGVNGPTGFDRNSSDQLIVADGGENGENIPFNPMLAPARRVDVIVAADASSDTQASDPHGANWPNGAAMINTWLRTHKVSPPRTSYFPPVPLDIKVWSSHGFNTRPTFFGCNPPTTNGNGGYPLVIYLPNSPFSSYHTNTSTFKLQYSPHEATSFVNSVMNITGKPLLAPNQVDNNWPTCMSCALIDRARNRQKVPRSVACQQCFARYCYQDGARDHYQP